MGRIICYTMQEATAVTLNEGESHPLKSAGKQRLQWSSSITCHHNIHHMHLDDQQAGRSSPLLPADT